MCPNCMARNDQNMHLEEAAWWTKRKTRTRKGTRKELVRKEGQHAKEKKNETKHWYKLQGWPPTCCLAKQEQNSNKLLLVFVRMVCLFILSGGRLYPFNSSLRVKIMQKCCLLRQLWVSTDKRSRATACAHCTVSICQCFQSLMWYFHLPPNDSNRFKWRYKLYQDVVSVLCLTGVSPSETNHKNVWLKLQHHPPPSATHGAVEDVCTLRSEDPAWAGRTLVFLWALWQEGNFSLYITVHRGST